MRKLIFTLGITMVYLTAYCQEEIRGKVISSVDGEPLIGATIALKNQNVKANTNRQGEFLLISKRSDTLEIRNIGFISIQKEVKLTRNGYFNIVLKPSLQSLKEVIVSTGYQTLPKERSTGSFTLIDQKLFSQQTTPTILERLPNIAATASQDNRTSTPGLSVRGLSTIEGTKGPLIVLNSFPYYGNLDNLNPNDVESITILKDAAAASIWGTKAGNGVIVITTKQGKFGSKLNTEFNSSIAIGHRPNLSQLKQISASDLIDVEEMLFAKGKYDLNSPDAALTPVTPVIDLLRKKAAGQISSQEADAKINEFRSSDIRNDFEKYLYQSSINQQYSLNLNAGSEKVAWKTLAGFDRNISNLNALSSRGNLNFQTRIKPVSNLEFSGTVMITHSKNQSGKTGYGQISMIDGQLPVYTKFKDKNGQDVPIGKDYSFEYLKNAGDGKLLDWKYYPLEDYKHNVNKNEINDLLTDFSVKYGFLKYFSLSLAYRYQNQRNSGSQLFDIDSYYARNLINNFSQIDAGSGEVFYQVPVGGISDKSVGTLTTNQFRSQLNFAKNWGNHSVNFLTGAELSEDKTETDAYRTYGYDPNTLTYANVNYNAWYPGFANGAYSPIPNNRSLTGNSNRFTSIYFNASYLYRERYILSLSARKDGSNLFGVLPNNRFNPLGSVGFAWDISKEDFFVPGIFQYLKFRSTYGISGNTDQRRTAFATISYLSNSPYTQSQYANIVTYANPELKWEKVGMLNLAIDFSSKNNRISGSIEYYTKNANDLFGRGVIDYTGGVGSSIVKNVGAMKGKGLDLDLNTLNLTGSFQWASHFGLSLYKDRITSYYSGGLEGNRYISGTTPLISGVVGKPVYSIYSYSWSGLDPINGDPQGLLKGKVSKDYDNINGSGTKLDDLVYSGSALPTAYGFLANTFTYNNFSLSFSINYKFGYYLRKSSLNYTSLFDAREGHSDFAHRWLRPGDEKITNIPSMIYPASSARDEFYNNSTATIIKGDQIRLQYINLGYNLDQSRNKWSPFPRADVYVNINNIGLLWRANKDGIDPDYPINSLSTPMNIVFGLRTSF